MVKAVCYSWMIILKCTVLVHSTGFESLDFELTDEVDMPCVDINLGSFYSDYSDILNSPLRANVQTDASSGPQSVLQEEQALKSSCALYVPALSNAVNTVGVNEGSFSSASTSLSLPSTSTDAASSISSVQVQSPAGSAKRACDTAKKEEGEQRARKRQKAETTATVSEINSALMDETEVCLVIEEFNRYFGDGAKIMSRVPTDMMVFIEDLVQRGLKSVHSREIMEKCIASEQWLRHSVFWRMLVLFMGTLSLEVATSNRLEDKKTVVLRVRKIREKSLFKHTDRYIYRTIIKVRDAERMKIECNLSFMEDRGAANVLAVLRWLLYHVKIECVGIACDLTEVGMNSAVLGRHLATLTQEWKGSRVRIDSLALRFILTQYKEAAEIVKEYSTIPVLKIHFIAADPWESGSVCQALRALLQYCPLLEQLSVFGTIINTAHIRTITAMLPQLVLLEVESLTSECQKEEEESMPVFSGLKTLKIPTEYKFSVIDIKKFVCLFPNLQTIQMPAKYVSYSRLDALSKLSHLRSLETVNGLLLIKTVECLLETLPTLECLSVGVKELDNRLAQVLSKYVGMHTLKLRGKYTSGFLASLLRPSPLMCTLRVLEIRRYSIDATNSFTLEDQRSRQEAMKKFGCMVQIIYD